MRNRFITAAFILISFINLNAQKADKLTQKRLATIDLLCQKALSEFNVPGMAVGIVMGDTIIFSKGYGVRDLRTGSPVDGNTQFAVASNSKAFTAASLAIMVDEGKLKWDDPVRKYLPDFTLYDPYVSEAMTVRDLLCHRSGLATFSGDLIWYGTDKSREEVVANARYLKPTMGFRAGFGYSNIMFLAAGEVLEKVSGTSWDRFVLERFFRPLNMQHTNTSVTGLDLKGNVAMPHNEVEGKNVAIEYVNWDNIGPAGSINSSANDMSQWLRLQLKHGNWRGKQIWAEARTWEMWENQTPKPVGAWQRENMPSRHWNGYGLGWDLMEFGGYKVVSHGGGYDGMISKTMMVPELGLGVVILTNNINNVPTALSFEILEEFMGMSDNRDWLTIFLGWKTEDEKETTEKMKKEEEARHKNTSPSLPLTDYCGTYRSEMYGDVVVRQDETGSAMRIDFLPTPLFKGNLSHWHHDTFQLKWTTQMMLPPGKVNFILDNAGQVVEIKVDVPNPDFDFSELILKKITDN